MSERIPELYNFVNNVYRTDTKRVSFLGKLVPTLYFYSRVIAIVVSAGYRAKINKYSKEKYTHSSFDTVRALEAVGIPFEISGIEHVKNLQGPCVFIGNHMSTLETFMCSSLILPIRDFTFVVKQALLEFPLFKHIMKFTDAIAVGRQNPREDLTTVLKEGEAKIKNGTSIIIFPQRTRTVNFSAKDFNTIGIKLAIRANAPVVPVAFKTDVWKNGKIFKDFGGIDTHKKAYIRFGEAMNIQGRGKEEHQKIIAFITDNLKNWGHSVAIGDQTENV
jgi:1-acyl-sn-glycerol-3-phosphate acyltransferase